MSVKELRIAVLYRDPSVISRLYSAYAAARDAKKEAGTDPHALLPVKFGRRSLPHRARVDDLASGSF